MQYAFSTGQSTMIGRWQSAKATRKNQKFAARMAQIARLKGRAFVVIDIGCFLVPKNHRNNRDTTNEK
jgi:hypothetical protein